MKRRAARLFVNLLGVAALGLLLWPLVFAVLVSFSPGDLLEPPTGEWSLRWYRDFFANPLWRGGLSNSLIVAGQSVVLTLLLGLAAAASIVHYRAPGARVFSLAVLLPMFVPGVALAMGLLPLVRASGLWGTRLSLALAHSVIALPIVFLLLRGALEDLDPNLLAAARGLGVGPLGCFFRVTLPLLSPALSSAAALAAVLSLQEFILTLFLATPEIETLPKVIWPNLRYTLTPLVAAASTVLLGVTLLGLATLFIGARIGGRIGSRGRRMGGSVDR